MILLHLEILGGKDGETMEAFFCKTRILAGEGALKALGEQKPGRLLVVTETTGQDPNLRRVLRSAGAGETECFRGVEWEPTMARAVEGSRRIKAFRPDLTVAVGGRSAVDCAKAMVCFAGKPCLLAAVPTAFGAGSEVTARVTLAHGGRYHLLENSAMQPDLALLEPGLTECCSRRETAEGGFDLLAAALESYAAGDRRQLGHIHSREAFTACWGALSAACAGELRSRERLQMASVLAGLAENAGDMGLCRAMANSLGAVLGLPRGQLAAILLPAVMGCNVHAAGGRYAQLARAAGMGGSREEIGIRNLKTGLIRLRRELGLPGTLAQAGVDLRRVWSEGKRIVALTLEDPCCRSNPVAPDDFLVRRILEEITGRI